MYLSSSKFFFCLKSHIKYFNNIFLMFLYYLTEFLTFNLILNYKFTQNCELLKTLKKLKKKTSGYPILKAAV